MVVNKDIYIYNWQDLNIQLTAWPKLGMYTNKATENRGYGHRVCKQANRLQAIIWTNADPIHLRI